MDIPSSTTLQALNVADNDFVVFNCHENTALTTVLCPPTVEKLLANGCSILESIDVSHILELKELNVNNCSLTSLDIRNNLNLMTLLCDNNKITTINVQNNTNLKIIDLSNNNLTAINLRQNANLQSISINNNSNISILDLSNNTHLKELRASGISITDLDLTNNEELELVALFNPSLKTIIGLSSSAGIIIKEKSESSSGLAISHLQVDLQFDDVYGWCQNIGSGWTTPQVPHFNEIFKVKDLINNVPAFVKLEGNYWTYTYSSGYGYKQYNMDSGKASNLYYGSYHVRAIREF